MRRAAGQEDHDDGLFVGGGGMLRGLRAEHLGQGQATEAEGSQS